LRPDDEVELLTEEPHLSYSRMLLPDYIAGRISLSRLWLRPDSHYEENRIQARLRTRVIAVRPKENVLLTDKGESIFYDRLLIACGGKAKLPPINGLDHVPALTLETLDDARHIMSVARRGASVLVVARDLIGVEITRAFCQMGLRVTYIEWGDDLLPHILDPATAQELADKMRNAGVTLVVGELVQAIEADGKAVILETAMRRLQGDLLSVAIGKAPHLDWLSSSGIMTGSGIIADERLRTNFPSIYAAGDAAEVYDSKTRRRKLLFGWKNAVEQGRIAGANMCGEMKEFEVTYAPGIRQIFGVDVRHRWK
jgi:NAD(P)H-nitrite reductase large subunit